MSEASSIDRRRRAEQDLVEAEASALLAPGLLHELRQPLMGLRAGLELALRESGGSVQGLEWFRLVEAQAERLTEIVRGFEELFAAPQVRLQSFLLGEAVERGVALMRFRLRPLGERFLLETPPPELRSHGSRAAVLHALTNLLVNAADAVGEAGPEARIAVRVLSPDGGRREVRVSDEGGGIAPGLKERLFAERITTKGARGSGLGLQIARRAMQRTGGDVRLVGDGDPARLPWARTEFCIEVEQA